MLMRVAFLQNKLAAFSVVHGVALRQGQQWCSSAFRFSTNSISSQFTNPSQLSFRSPSLRRRDDKLGSFSNSKRLIFASASSPSPKTADKMAIRLIPNKNLHVSTPTWWLESRFHFSFADYFNPSNTEFGVLRVLNDDLVQPHSGFGTHPHRDMEIITYIVDGQLTHKDSMGTAESLGRGCVQYMSAGTGITHSEMNGGSELLRFLQIWIKPNARALKPNYGSRVFRKEDRHNQLQHILTSFDRVASDGGSGVIPIHQDANIYVSELDPGKTVTLPLETRRQAYLVCIEGGLTVAAGATKGVLQARDAAEVKVPKGERLALSITADEKQGTHFLVIEMAQH